MSGPSSLVAQMAADEFAALGARVWGPEWKPAAARLFDCSLGSVKRWASGAYRVPPRVALQLRMVGACTAAQNALPMLLHALDELPGANMSGGIKIVLSQKSGDAAQALANDIAIATIQRAGILPAGSPVEFQRVETAAETPEERALEAALGRQGSRAEFLR